MNWTTAWLTMKQGYKVKRHGWKKAYWRIAGTEVIIHTEGDAELNFREVTDIGMMLNVTCCEDWEQVLEEPKERFSLTEAAQSLKMLVDYPVNVNDPEEVRAWLAEMRKYTRAARVIEEEYKRYKENENVSEESV